MRLQLALAGKLRKVGPQVERVWRDSCAAVFTRRITQLKNAIRKEIVASGLGERLAKTVRSRLFKTSAGELGGAVFSNALLKRPGGVVDLLTAFQRQITITGSGKFLAIPLTNRKSSADNRRRATPEDFPAGTFDLVPLLRRGNYLLTEKTTGDAVFLLVRRVTIGKRLSSFATQVARANRGIDAACAKEAQARLEKIFKRAA